MIQKYINSLNQRYKQGNATEHTYRGDLENLIENLIPNIRATNEPKRQACGAPDYILTNKGIPVGFIEAKDIGDKDLKGENHSGNKEQFDRYKASLNNLLFTDYINFYLYQDGVFVTKVSIGELKETGIIPLPQNFEIFENLMKDFCVHISQTIKSPDTLAKMMAGKARLLSDVIEKSLTNDIADNLNPDTPLQQQYDAFKSYLIHDIDPKSFADVYSQTITYGLFAARLHDPTIETFSRQEAAELIPKSNPFLRKLFQFIAGYDLDKNLVWIVDNLVDIFIACNVDEILKKYGKSTRMEDPIIHFYETFLSEYDSDLRKARGVWYTPSPVVKFIVRAVDDILKNDFNLSQGLADSSKTKIKVDTQNLDKRTGSRYRQEEREVHKVQILDPAVGTGTFLSEVIKYIFKNFQGNEGIWSSYVENHLIPRLNGFEILMASYAMAHLKTDLLYRETGFKPIKKQRTKIYLTNSLEESHPDTGTLFANWLSSESNEANFIKRDSPVMCVIGNPPYSVSSSNKGEWIEKLLQDYKKDLNERNIQPLSDDYIKFIRYGQYHIQKNGSGVLAYISNSSFIAGIIHKQMRKDLLQTFDKVYILDLHGNSRKKEVSPDGSPDENVFDIMAGVSINIFVKTGDKKNADLGQVLHKDLWGKRELKYSFLEGKKIDDIKWEKLENVKPNYFFVPKDLDMLESFGKLINLKDLFTINSMGIATGKDSELVKFSKNDFSDDINSDIRPFFYRPFDVRYTVFDNKILQRARFKHMSNYVNVNNIGINIVRQSKLKGLEVLLNTDISNRDLITNHTYNFPLYLYPKIKEEGVFGKEERKPNLNIEMIQDISNSLGLSFTSEKEELKDSFSPIDILDYIYAVLHSLSYREKYKELLETDFPRVPYPKDKYLFWKLVELGAQLRKINLLEINKENITTYPIGGDNVITRKMSKSSPGFQLKNENTGKVWINDEQYFDNIPLNIWEFYIGGYQPAQKWLKDRYERTLSFEDILHYQKIITALTETDMLMKEIDKIEIE